MPYNSKNLMNWWDPPIIVLHPITGESINSFHARSPKLGLLLDIKVTKYREIISNT